MLEKHRAIQARYSPRGQLGPVAKLMPTSSAVTVRQQGPAISVLDGPYAESKEHLLGIYFFECASLEDAIEIAREFPQSVATYEVRPVEWASEGLIQP